MHQHENGTNIILAINPPHFTNVEAYFWFSLARSLETQGWHLVRLTTFEMPPLPYGATHALSPLLMDLGPMRARLAHLQTESPAWLSPDALESMIDWQLLRNPQATDRQLISQHIRALAHWNDLAIRLLKPHAVLTCNKLDIHPALGWLAAKHYRVLEGMVERSPFDDLWFEPEGLFSESRIWREVPDARTLDCPEYRAVGNKVVASLRSNPHGFRRDQRGDAFAPQVRNKLKKPIFLLPMDNVLWTGWMPTGHPQGRVDYYFEMSPQEMITHLAELVASLGGSLILKRHPACTAIPAQSIPQEVIQTDADIGQLLELCDVVICFNTKVAFAAIASHLPTVTLAPNPVAAANVTYHTDKIADIPDALTAAMMHRDLSKKLDRFIPFAGWLKVQYFWSFLSTPLQGMRTPEQFAKYLMSSATSPQTLSPEDFRRRVSLIGYAAGRTTRTTPGYEPLSTQDAQADLDRMEAAWPGIIDRHSVPVAELYADKAELRRPGIGRILGRALAYAAFAAVSPVIGVHERRKRRRVASEVLRFTRRVARFPRSILQRFVG